MTHPIIRVLFVSSLLFAIAPRQAAGQDLLVSSRFTNQVLRYDARTGAFVGAFASGGGLANPVGEGFGPDGNLYVVSKNTLQVLRYDGSSGAFLGVFVDDPSLVEARHLTFGPDGNLYVSQVSPEQVRRYNGTTGASMGVFATNPNIHGGTLAIEFMPHGDMLVGSALTNQILRFDGNTGTYRGVFASGGGLDLPQTLAYGPDGSLYVVSGNSGTILRFDGETGALLGTFASGLAFPTGFAFAPDGKAYVTTLNDNAIVRLDAQTGANLGTFVPAGSGGMNTPVFLLVKRLPTFEISTLYPSVGSLANRIQVVGAQGGARIALYTSPQAGAARIDTCGTLAIRLDQPVMIGVLTADGAGDAEFAIPSSVPIAGTQLLFAAADLSTCHATGAFGYTFP
jgi:DNA-binding beta-propeller fold protein YncE